MQPHRDLNEPIQHRARQHLPRENEILRSAVGIANLFFFSRGAGREVNSLRCRSDLRFLVYRAAAAVRFRVTSNVARQSAPVNATTELKAGADGGGIVMSILTGSHSLQKKKNETKNET
jgi:hypothetical protein